MISHEKKFVFVHVPRTGGYTLSNILRPYCDEESLERFSRFGEKRNLHATMIEYADEYGYEILQEYTFFSIVRNPFDRALSHSVWHNGGTFDREHFRNYVFRPTLHGFWPHSHFHFYNKPALTKTLISGRPDKPEWLIGAYPPQISAAGMKNMQEMLFFPYFIKFENYANEISKLFIKLGIEHNIEDLKTKINCTTRKHYSHYYLDDEINEIKKNCGFDLQVFGYTFEDKRNK